MISDWGQFNMVFCASAMAQSRCSFKPRKIGHVDLWAVNRLPQLTPQHLLSPDRVVIIRTKQGLADSLQLSPCVDHKLIHVDGSDGKMSMPPDLNTGVCDLKQSQSQHGW